MENHNREQTDSKEIKPVLPPKNFSKLSNALWNDRALTSSEKLVYACLVAHCFKNSECYPSQALIAAETGLSRSSVIRALYGHEAAVDAGGLIGKGWLETFENGDGRQSYRLFQINDAGVPERYNTSSNPADFTVPQRDTNNTKGRKQENNTIKESALSGGTHSPSSFSFKVSSERTSDSKVRVEEFSGSETLIQPKDSSPLYTSNAFNISDVKDATLTKDTTATISSERFKQWYGNYDYKIASVALTACQKLWDGLSPADQAAAIEQVKKYVASTPDKKYRKRPDNYLRGRCWEEEIISRAESDSKGLKCLPGERLPDNITYHSSFNKLK